MKRLLFLSVLFSLVCLCSSAIAQELRIVTLDCDNNIFATPSRVVLKPGDSLQFKSINGDFNIYIADAIRYFDIDQADIQERIDSNNRPFSEIYQIRTNDTSAEITYAIYCIDSNSWPDAPPRIIIVSQ